MNSKSSAKRTIKRNIELNYHDHDRLDRKEFGKRLYDHLIVDSAFEEGSLVVSLESPFGSGKTHFLLMWMSYLDMLRSTDPAVPEAIYVNAWESDYCGDPLLAIVSQLVLHIKPATKRDTDKIKNAVKDFSWFGLHLLNSVVSQSTGADPIAAGEFSSAKRAAREPRKPDMLRLYEDRRNALRELKETLKKVYAGEQPKAFVIIDELDRCRPDYAISYLETIKHIFDIHGLVFLLAVDRGQLKSSAQRLFGEMEFDDYYRKFVHRSLPLALPDKESVENLIRHYVSCYVRIPGRRDTLLSVETCLNRMTELAIAVKMRPRPLKEAFRIIGYALVRSNEHTNLIAGWQLGIVAMSFFKTTNHPLYQLLADRELRLTQINEACKLLIRGRDEFWLPFIVMGKHADEADWGIIGQFSEGCGSARRAWGIIGNDKTDHWYGIARHIESASRFV